MKQHGPWKIKSSEVKYKNPWMEIREDQVIRPDGKDGIYGTALMKDGVSVLALDEKGDAYLTKEFHYAIGSDRLETVSGGRDKGESYLDTAKRELIEEAGITATEWTDLGITDPLTSLIDCPQGLFLARGLTFAAAHQEGNEKVEMIKVPFTKAIQMVLASEITHAPSCLLILKAAKYLGKL